MSATTVMADSSPAPSPHATDLGESHLAPVTQVGRALPDLDGRDHGPLDDQVQHASPASLVPGHELCGAETEHAGDVLSPSQSPADDHLRRAGGNCAVRHESFDGQRRDANGIPFPPASDLPSPKSAAPGGDFGRQEANDIHRSVTPVAADAHLSGENQRTGGSAAFFLSLAAASLDDIERTRIAMENRIRAMRDDHGLQDEPALVTAEAMHAALAEAEKQAEKLLKRTLKTHPLGPWVKTTVGVGEKQGARLLAAIGDPYIKPAMYGEDDTLLEAERPRRGPAELRQYCGHGDPDRSRRRKGQRVEFNPEAKMRVHLIAESCIKQAHSPYRAVYDAARMAKRDAVHAVECVRCGPRGKPAKAGSPWSLGHQHAHALRLVGKAVLKDLFLEAKRLSSS